MAGSVSNRASQAWGAAAAASPMTSARPGAIAGPAHGAERAAQPEDERDQQVLEARTGAVSGDRRRSEAPDEAGGDGDREVGRHRDEGGDHAHAQDVAEQGP